MSKPYADPARKAWPFFALFVLVGLVMMVPFVLQAVKDYRIAFLYQRAEAEVMDRRTVISESTSRLGGRWVTGQNSHTVFTWAYRVDKRHHVAEGFDNYDGVMADDQEGGNLAKGTKTECWYDPDNPDKSVLVRHFHPKFYLGSLIPGSFVFFGGLFMRGALRRRPMKLAAPVVAGTRLKYQLSPLLSTRRTVGCLGLVMAVLAVFVIFGLPRMAVGDDGSSLIGGKAWVYLICVGIEVFLGYHFARSLFAARVADPVVEIDDEPLNPGQTTRFFLSQPGPAVFRHFEVQVACEKIGSNGTHVAHKQCLIERRNLRVEVNEEFSGSFTIPTDAPSSMKTLQTSVTWCVRLRRALSGTGSYDTDYSFRVETRRLPSEGD